MLDNKRGQGMSTNTIILLILGVVILVVLIVGFTMGWSQFSQWFKSDNVQAIVTQCSVACSTGDEYNFCSKERTLKSEDFEIKTTCNLFARLDSLNYYHIADCNLNCDKVKCADIKVMIDGSEKNAVLGSAACVAPEQDVTILVSDTDGTTPFCCIEGLATFFE